MLSSLSAWVFSIAGIVCISVLVELILPSGQMNKYIKGVLSFLVIFVIIMPLPSLLHSKFDFSGILDYDRVEVDEEYLYQLNVDKLNSIKEDIEDEILRIGYNNVIVSLNADIFASNVNIKSVTVDLTQLVISSAAKHKDIVEVKSDILLCVEKYIKIEEGYIYFDE